MSGALLGSRLRHPRSFGAVTRGLVLIAVSILAASAPLAAQGHGEQAWEPRGSSNVRVLGHLPLGPGMSVADVELEQEEGRPFAYVGRIQYQDVGPKGMDVVGLEDPGNPKVLYEWRIEDEELHRRVGGMDVKYFKWKGRYYVVQSLQFVQGGPDQDLGAVVLDVTSLPDTSRIREVARIREPEEPNGFHNIFVYRHSNGRVYLFATVSGPHAHVYDLGMVVEGRVDRAHVANVPLPEGTGGQFRGYHDFYVGYHPGSGTDRFYGGGTGGYYVYDMSDIPTPDELDSRPDSLSPTEAFPLLTSVTGVPGVRSGHTFTPGPNGRYVVAETEYQYAPLRIFDLRPGLEGEVETIDSPISAWTANWRHLAHNHEVRWPFVFVSAYEDGLQVFSLQDPENPETVAWYDTYLGPHGTGGCGGGVCNGAFGVDVRNRDGLIVISDLSTGLWTFRMEGFQGWSGEEWGVPDVSSVQKWDEGPGR